MDRPTFYVVFNVPRERVDMEQLRQQVYAAIERGGFAWDFAVDFVPDDGGSR